MEIKIKDKYGVTLKTKGKYCDDNIDILVDESLITPKLQDKKVTENGEVVADEGFDGLGKVTVEVTSSFSVSDDGVLRVKNASLKVNDGKVTIE